MSLAAAGPAMAEATQAKFAAPSADRSWLA